jgi:antitoxin component HigA of HigAB toxin-antitoxin module
MADDREIQIRITAKNLTSDEFEKVRKNVAAVANETKTSTDRMSGWANSVKGAAGLVGLTFSVGAVVEFGKKVFDTASQIHDMALKLGVSAEAAQGFKFAAEQGGSSIEAVGKAITKMNGLLVEGDKGTVKALEKLGLKFSDIRGMKPEDAFLAIADEIKKIPDPMEQSRVAVELFGKTGAELLPAIKEGFREVSDGASKMSNDTIDSLEAAQDAWSSLSNSVVIATGTIIGHTISAAKEMTSSASGFATWVQNAIKHGPAVAFTFADAATQAKKAAKELTEEQKTGIQHLIKIGNSAEAVSELFGEASEAALKYGRSLSEAAKPTAKTKEETEALEKAQKKAQQAAEQHAAAITSLRDSMFGNGAIKAANDLTQALGSVTNISKLSKEQQAEVNVKIGEATEALTRLGKKAPETYRAWFEATAPAAAELKKLDLGLINLKGTVETLPSRPIQELSERTLSLVENLKLLPIGKRAIDGLADATEEFSREAKEAEERQKRWNDATKVAEERSKRFDQSIGELASSLSNLANIAGGTFGGIVRDIGTMISALDTAKKSQKAFSEGLGDFRSGDTLTGILGMASGIGGIASAAISAGKAIWGMFSKTESKKVNDLRDEFLLTFGVTGTQIGSGFATLAAKLAEMGQAGVDAFDRLVRAKKQAEYDKALAEVNRLLDEQKKKHEESAKAAEDASARERAAADAYTDRIKAQLGELDRQQQTLMESIAGEAPEEFMGAVEAQTRARIAQIEAEKQALLKQQGDAIQEAEKVRDRVEDIWDDPIHVPIVYDYPNGSSSPLPEPTERFASGGIVSRPTVALVGEAGRKEIIGDQSFMTSALMGAINRIGSSGLSAAGVAGSDRPIVIENVLVLDGQVIDRRTLKTVQAAALSGQVQIPSRAIRGPNG